PPDLEARHPLRQRPGLTREQIAEAAPGRTVRRTHLRDLEPRMIREQAHEPGSDGAGGAENADGNALAQRAAPGVRGAGFQASEISHTRGRDPRVTGRLPGGPSGHGRAHPPWGDARGSIERPIEPWTDFTRRIAPGPGRASPSPLRRACGPREPRSARRAPDDLEGRSRPADGRPSPGRSRRRTRSGWRTRWGW